MGNQRYEAFLNVAATGSFKEAAREMGYTQAGISYLVSALEKELDTTLFMRDYGGARLTAEGADLLPWIQDVSNAERRLSARVDDVKHLERGTVRVATFTSTAIQWLPGIAKAYLAQHPAIDLQIICLDDQDELEEMVRHGNVDCGFVVFPLKQDLHALPLRSDELLVVVPPDHPDAHAPFFSIEAMRKHPYIRSKSGSFSEMDALFKKHGVEPNVRFSIDSDYAVMSMVSAGLGYSVLPELILRDVPFPLVRLAPELPTKRDVALALRSLDSASGATKAFIEVTQAWVEQAYR